MKEIKKALFDRMPPLWRHILVLWGIATIPALIIGAVTNAVAFLLEAPPPNFGSQHSDQWISAFQSIAFAPFVETLLLCALIEISTSLGVRKIFIAASAAAIAGLLHAFITLIWFFTSAWAFFVYACAYLAWRSASFSEAFAAAAVVHALNNATGVAMLFLIALTKSS